MEEVKNRNTNKSFMVSDYGSEKLSKEKELNSSMSVSVEKSQDKYESTIHTLGGRGNE